ncbi:MAG: thermosome subunit beta [Candidatus Helarchaeota archaeon]
MAQLSGTPVLILKEGAERTRGNDAQSTNIMAAKVIAENVRTSLGPKGLDKMLVDSFGDVTITNDGATILKEIDVQQPAAKMMVEIAKTQDDEVGDGTTTAVILAGEFLKSAENLLEQKIHPAIIIEGYRLAADKSIEILDNIAIPINVDDEQMLRNIANTSMISKVIGTSGILMSDIAVKAIKAIAENRDGKMIADLDNISIQKKEGGSIDDSKIISGLILDKEIVHSGMAKTIENAKIALLETALEIEKTEFDAKINITEVTQMQAFLNQEEQMLRKMVDKIKASGANVVLCQKGIDDMVQHFLAKAGISAARRIKKSDMEKLAKATGGTVITNLDDLSEADLGKAGIVEERKIGNDNMIFVEKCNNPHAISILIRGGTKMIVDEADRALHDALCVVRNAVEEPKVVVGGGASEIEVSQQLQEYANKFSGRVQMAIRAFADAMEIIPVTLAENGGLETMDILVELRAKHKEGGKTYGVNVFEGKVMDMAQQNVYEGVVVKKQAIKSASESAQLILRIDDVIAASKSGGGAPGMPPGGPPGGDED